MPIAFWSGPLANISKLHKLILGRGLGNQGGGGTIVPCENTQQFFKHTV